MKPIVLHLTTARGDELGRVSLPNVQVAPEGEASTLAVRPLLIRQMEDLCGRIREVLAGEGVTVAMEEIDLRIAVSLALVAPDADEVLIPLTVQEGSHATRTRTDIVLDEESFSTHDMDRNVEQDVNRGVGRPTAASATDDSGDASGWDDLFDLDAFDPESRDHGDALSADGVEGGRTHHV
jgi:hypothetical protein